MTRFFVAPEEFQPDFMVLTGENAKHAKVLRLKNGEEVLVCDGQGRESLCAVSDVSDGQISLVVQGYRGNPYSRWACGYQFRTLHRLR